MADRLTTAIPAQRRRPQGAADRTGRHPAPGHGRPTGAPRPPAAPAAGASGAAMLAHAGPGPYVAGDTTQRRVACPG